jgi:hypothetical protein
VSESRLKHRAANRKPLSFGEVLDFYDSPPGHGFLSLADSCAAQQCVIGQLCESHERLRGERDELVLACQRWQASMCLWLETGVPSSPEESKSIFDQVNAAVELVTGKPCPCPS